MNKEKLKQIATEAYKRKISPKPIIIPKNFKYDRLTITKQNTWDRLGVWLI